MNKVTISAPGKLILFGEHAVVWGFPCIVTAVDKRISVTIEKTDENYVLIEAPDVQINSYKKSLPQFQTTKGPKEVEFIEEAVKYFYKTFSIESGLKITTKSEFSSLYGFGSSSAVTACTLSALAKLFNKDVTKRELFDLSYNVILRIQKVGSGFDLASAIYGGTLYFVTGGKVIRPLKVKNLPLVVGYTGIKASTPVLINRVGEFKKENPRFVNTIFKEIEYVTNEGKKALLLSDWKKTGRLMNINHGLLDALGVSCLMLSKLVYASRMAGAYGAKLSGAGGGDCMIAFTPPENLHTVEHAIEKEDGTVIWVRTNAEGIRIEN